ncbi:MAG: hypothetical protein IT427_13840 [Pirellulales bacterium]|nr:hypothetical protein [Pirellulales bacterium]
MNVTYSCPKCESINQAEIGDDATAMSCSHCEHTLQIPPGALNDGKVTRCLACPSADLFVRKDFPQRLGVTLVTIGLLGSSVAWAYGYLYWTFGILFASALVDLLLYALVPNALMCYHCGAMYRGVRNMEEHGSFSLEVHERHRQQKIRLAELQHAQSARQPISQPIEMD